MSLASLLILQTASFGAGSFLNAGAQLSCTPPPSGMISWWPGDGDANDIQDGNHGTLVNGATFAAGEVDQAFSLDGVNDWVEIPDSPSLTPSSMSIDAWVKPTTLDGTIISKYDSDVVNGVSWELLSFGGGRLEFGVIQAGAYVGAPTTVYRIIDTDNPALTLGQWQHVAATFDIATQEIKIYVNGVEAPSTLVPGSSTITSIVDSPTPVVIGMFRASGSVVGPVHFWNGLVDEVEIFDRALTQSEIQSIYNAGSAGKCKPTCTPPPSGMISWWPGDGNFNDIRDGNAASLTSGVTFAAGEVGQAFKFTGTAGQFVDIADGTNLRPQQFTVDLWATRNGPGQNEDAFGTVLVQKGFDTIQVNPALSYGIWWRNTDGMIRAFVGFVGEVSPGLSSLVLDSQSLFPVGSTVHVALTYDGSSAKLYVNGMLEDAVIVSKTVAYGPGTVTIGSTVQFARNDGFPRTFNGLIDEVELFNRALSQSEIQSIYNAGSAGKCKAELIVIKNVTNDHGGTAVASDFTINVSAPNPASVPPPSGMVSWWPGDGNAMDIEDGNHGTLVNGATFAAGKVGQGFSFDGVDDYVNLDSASSGLAFGITDDYSVDAWFKTTTVPAAGGVIYQIQDTDFNPTLAIVVRSDGHVDTFVQNDSVISTLVRTQSEPGFNDGLFHHVAVVYSGHPSTPTMKLYIDGVLKDTDTASVASFTAAEFHLTKIGTAAAAPGTQMFNGLIDEVEVFSRALTQSEIQSIYNAGSAGKIKSSSDPSPASFPGSSSGTAVALNPGSYSVSETGPAGYSSTLSADCSGTIAAGETKTCTITNDDIQPKLIVIKHVINDNGGTALASSFTMSVTGTDVSPNSFPGEESPGTMVGLDAGSYSVGETGPSGYTRTDSADCAGTISIGETKTCTVTNDDIQPQLIVIKHVINDNGGTAAASDFTMSVTGTNANPSSFPGAESPGTAVTLDAGSYSVTETGPAGYSMSASADCSGTIAIGETKTCTITNDDVLAANVFIAEDDDLHVHYQSTNKAGLSFNGYACIKDGKQMKNCKVPLKLGPIGDSRNEEVTIATKKIYTLSQLLTATGATGFGQIKPQCKNIYDNSGITPLATVNEVTAQEIVGVPSIQDYVAIKRVGIYDPGTSSTYITTVCKLVEQGSFTIDSNSDTIPDTAKLKLKVMKVVKPSGIQLMPADDVVFTGSQLVVTYPTEALWEEGVNDYVYPYIFTSDSDWSVNLCSYAPEGYVVAGVYDEFGNLISDSNCVQNFVSNETKVVAFEIIDVGSPKKFNINTDIDVKHKGKSKHSSLATDTERVPKDKTVKEDGKGKGKGKGNGNGENDNSSHSLTFSVDGFVTSALSSMLGLLSSITPIIISAGLAGIGYFSLGYFLSHGIRRRY